MTQLLADCLNDIFEYLKDDIVTLHSCLLVNRLWCEVSVKFLWRDTLNYNYRTYNTLIACLPNESKEILCKNGIIISTSTSKPPIFNYATFCKVLVSINQVNNNIEELLKNQQSISFQIINNNINDYISNNTSIVSQEIFKMFMNQINSLNSLTVWRQSINFTLYPGAKDFLKNLSELDCSSDIDPECFHQLSQACHNISLLDISLKKVCPNELTNLISVQKNLKYFSIKVYDKLEYIPPSLITKLPNTLIKFSLLGYDQISLSFIAKFTDLHELRLTLILIEDFKDFEILQYAIFPQLQVLKIPRGFPRCELLIKFLKINGRNLKEIYLGDHGLISDNSLNLAVAEFCPNLRKLSTGFKNGELDTLKIILNSCQYLESIKIVYDFVFLNKKEALETIVKYSQNISVLILVNGFAGSNDRSSEFLPEELESFFISWANRIPQKSLSLVAMDCKTSLDKNVKNMEIITKYIKLGVIKEFKVTDFDDLFNKKLDPFVN